MLQKLTLLTPVYHPQANPVERKNRDLKPQLAILVGNDHTSWPDRLPSIRFAMNSALNESTGYTAAYLSFGRELRTVDDIQHDLRSIVVSENFVAEITPKLLLLAETNKRARENVEATQRRNQNYTDNKRRADPGYKPGEKVWVKTHTLSNASKQFTAKFAPKRDGPYIVLKQHGPASYEIAAMKNPSIPIGTHHS